MRYRKEAYGVGKRRPEDELTTVSIVGLGRLGATIAGCWASRGFRVIGTDLDPRCVDLVQRGLPPVEETGLEEIFQAAGHRLTATEDAERAVLDSDMTLLVVPTPSRADGRYDAACILSACGPIGKALRRKDTYHLVVVKSTVFPGSSERDIVPALEATSEKICGQDFGYCYNPEFIALGSVVRNLLAPELLLIGQWDERSGELLGNTQARMLGTTPPTARMTCANAEIAKLAVNSYVTMKITFANSVAALCEKIPGGDADTVNRAVALDSRVGSRCFQGGLGFGGPCFPRDNRAMACLAEEVGASFPLAEATDRANEQVALRVAASVAEGLVRGSEISILGLSYKPDTPVVEESQGLWIARWLAERGFRVRVYDPLAQREAERVLGDLVIYTENVAECVTETDAVIIATPWEQFRHLPVERMRRSGPRLIFDCWGLCEETIPADVSYHRVGRFVAKHRDASPSSGREARGERRTGDPSVPTPRASRDHHHRDERVGPDGPEARPDDQTGIHALHDL